MTEMSSHCEKFIVTESRGSTSSGPSHLHHISDALGDRDEDVSPSQESKGR